MRRITLLSLLLSAILGITGSACAQSGFTTVTATVRDPNDVLYTNAPINITFYDPGTSGFLPTLGNGTTFQKSYTGFATDSFGTFTVSLADNNFIAAASGATNTQWRFSICAQAGTPCFTTLITITGSTQNPSAALKAAAAVLPAVTTFPPQNAHTFLGGPVSGVPANPSFRTLVGADLPFPMAGAAGGVFTKNCVLTNQAIGRINTDGTSDCTSAGGGGGSFTGGTVPNPTFFTSGIPSYDVKCTNSVTSDTSLMQTAVTYIRTQAVSYLSTARGIVRTWGPCTFNGSTLDLTGGVSRNDWLVVEQYGVVIVANSAIKLPQQTYWKGIRCCGAGTSFQQASAANIASVGDWPVFQTGTISDPLSQQQNVIIESLNMQINGATSATVHFYAPVQDTIRYSSIDNRAGVAFLVDQPGFLGGAGFGLTLWDDTFSTGLTGSPTIYTMDLTDVGNVIFGGDQASWLLGGGIKLTANTNQGGGMVVFNVSTEGIPNGGSFLTTDATMVPIHKITLTNIQPSDPVGTTYLYNNLGGTVLDLYIKGTSGDINALINPASTGSVQLSPQSDIALGVQSTDASLITLPDVLSLLPAADYYGRTQGLKDDVRRNASPVTVRYANTVDKWAPADWTPCAGGSTTITTGQADPFGGTQGVLMSSSSGSVQCNLYLHTENPPPVGTIYMGGMWAKASSATYGFNSGTNPFNMGSSGGATSLNGFKGTVPGFDQAWHWIPFVYIVTASSGASDIVLSAQDDNTTPTTYAFPIFIRIPAGTISGAEAVQLYQSLASYSTSCAIGALCTVNGSVSSTVNPGTTTGDTLYCSNTATPCTLARRAIGAAGDYQTPSSGVPVWQTPGVTPDQRTTTTEAVTCADRGQFLTFANAANIAVSIVSSASCGNNFYFNYKVIGAGKVTFTPTTSTIQVNDTAAAATMIALAGQGGAVTSDNTNYIATRYGYATGTTGTITSGALLAGACASGTVTILGATTAMVPTASPVTYPNDGNYWLTYVSAADTITVKVCAAVAGTPGNTAFNVRLPY